MILTSTFLLYLILVAYISWWAYRKTSASEDYFLGGRQLSAPTAALSAGASDMSGWLLIGLPGYAFASGLESIWLSTGLCLGLAVCWLSVARRLRSYTEQLDNSLTIPTYLQRRFNDKTPVLRLVTAFFILLFFLFYVSSGFVAGAKLFSNVFDTGYQGGLWLTFGFVVVYTFIGGFLAVSWTDVLQGLLMLLALLITPVMVIVANGGVDSSLNQVASLNPELLNPFTNAKGESLGWISIVSLLGWGFGYFGQPHILARFQAIKDSNDVSQASSIAIIWSLVVNAGAICVGLFAVVVFTERGAITDGEQIFMILANTLFHPVIAGVIMAAILAAIMSTADSQLLVCSSAIAEDMLAGKTNSDHKLLNPVTLGRISVFVIGFIALLFALDPKSQVLEIVSYAWGGLGAAFGPTILISLYSSRMSKMAALVGIVVGGTTVLVWKSLSGGIFELYELVPGFIFSSIAVFVTSFIKETEDENVKRHFESFQGQYRESN